MANESVCCENPGCLLVVTQTEPFDQTVFKVTCIHQIRVICLLPRTTQIKIIILWNEKKTVRINTYFNFIS